MLAAPPEFGPVCPACGTEFEVDDRYRSHADLKRDWLSIGAPWFSSLELPPGNWQEHRAALLAHRVAIRVIVLVCVVLYLVQVFGLDVPIPRHG